MANKHHHHPFKSSWAPSPAAKPNGNGSGTGGAEIPGPFNELAMCNQGVHQGNRKTQQKKSKLLHWGTYLQSKNRRFLLLKLYNFLHIRLGTLWIELCFDFKNTTQLPSDVGKLPSFHLSLFFVRLRSWGRHCPRDLPWTPFLRRALCSRSSFRVVSNKSFGGHGHGMVMETPVYPWPFIFTSKTQNQSWLAGDDKICKACVVPYYSGGIRRTRPKEYQYHSRYKSSNGNATIKYKMLRGRYYRWRKTCKKTCK